MSRVSPRVSQATIRSCLGDMAFKKQAIYVPFNKTQYTAEERAYYNAYALNTFGIVFTNPELASKEVIEEIIEHIPVEIPKSFYKNPQDLSLYSCSQLLLEQLVSYFIIAIQGEDNEDAMFDRVELFNKCTPITANNKDIKIRNFTIVDEITIDPILEDYGKSYAAYLRPFSFSEKLDATVLCEVDKFDLDNVKCKDNIITLLDLNHMDQAIRLAKQLDAKDVVKYSKYRYGIQKNLKNSWYYEHIINDKYLELMLKNCKLIKEISKKQAKGFNALCKLFNIDRHASSELNPDCLVKALLKDGRQGNVLSAARLYAKSGALLTRNLKFLLSRASDEEVEPILNLVECKTLASLMQLKQTLNQDTDEARVFVFTRDRLTKMHKETPYETEFRKSRLLPERKALLNSVLDAKIIKYLSDLPKLGKVYISDEFKNIALPLNTSANGIGLGVLPTGSRIKIKGDFIRTFCYWYDVFDIDTSVIYKTKEGRVNAMYWGNYASKPLGNSCLCSGDARGKNGAEYIDFKLKELKEEGIKYALFTLNGYGGLLNKGKIYCGYQDKSALITEYGEELINYKSDSAARFDDTPKYLNTPVWDPKNIAFNINVISNSRYYLGFIIDVENKELITLNINMDSDNRCVDSGTMNKVMRYVNPEYLSFSMFDVAKYRATELVDKPEDADVVFDREYAAKTEGQKIVLPSDISTLVELITK